jgi:hypothetical protein
MKRHRQELFHSFSKQGFVRFLESYYIVVVTKHSQVAFIGGHYVYHVEETAIIPVVAPLKNEKKADEAR